MTVTVRIFIAGLIAFLPSPDQKIIQALLYDARNPMQVLGCPQGVTHSHKPVLVARREDYVGDCPVVYVGQRKFCQWPLEKVSVALSGMTDPNLVRARGRRGVFSPHEKPQSANELPDFSWLADVDTVVPDGGKVRDDIGLGISNRNVVSRVGFAQGVLSVCHMVENKLGKVPRLRFEEVGTGSVQRYKQALADAVKLEGKANSGGVIVHLEKLDGSGMSDITLRPGAGHPNVLEFMVLNLPERRMIKPCECENGSDFAHYYDWIKRDRPSDHRIFLPRFDPKGDDREVASCERGTIVEEFLPRDSTTCAVFRLRNKEASEDDVRSLYTRPICPMGMISF